MLPRPKRLSRAMFGTVAMGKRAVSAHFSVTVRSTPESAAAAVVSKKVVKKSVDRHLVKRRILEVAKDHLVEGRSFIVFARAGSSSLPFSELKAELDELLSTALSV